MIQLQYGPWNYGWYSTSCGLNTLVVQFRDKMVGLLLHSRLICKWYVVLKLVNESIKGHWDPYDVDNI